MAALGLDGAFHIVPGAMEIVRKATGQRVYFRGGGRPDEN